MNKRSCPVDNTKYSTRSPNITKNNHFFVSQINSIKASVLLKVQQVTLYFSIIVCFAHSLKAPSAFAHVFLIFLVLAEQSLLLENELESFGVISLIQ